jgi:hypothetical protein
MIISAAAAADDDDDVAESKILSVGKKGEGRKGGRADLPADVPGSIEPTLTWALLCSQGQLDFLSLVDPAQLKGFEIEFFSGNTNTKITEEMKRIAKKRRINVTIHKDAANRT